MKNLLYLILVFLTFISCEICPSENEFIGKYYSQKEGIENYIEIKKNGEFTYFYSKGELILKHFGTWEKSKNGYCSLAFNEWKKFDEEGEKFEILGNLILYINGKYLDYSPDGETLSSFVKIENNSLIIGNGNDVIVTLKIEGNEKIKKIEFSSNNNFITINKKELTEKNELIYCDGEYSFENKIEAKNYKNWIAKIAIYLSEEKGIEKRFCETA